MEQILETLRRLGTARLVAMAGVGVGLLAFFVFLAARLSQSEMATLYTDLSQKEAGKVTQTLEEQNIQYKLANNGSTIKVPKKKVQQVRVNLAQSGNMPDGGKVGYEIFNKSDGLATSDFMRNINRLRALEGEIAQTIAAFENVDDARVHLVLPRREMFSRERQEPSASVFLKLAGSGTPSEQNMVAMQRLVAGAVPQLKPDNVTITDSGGTLLSEKMGKNGFGQQTPQEIQAQYERRLTREVESLLAATLGRDKVRANVTAEMNFDKVSKTVKSYNPDQQVARSEQSIEQSETERDADTVDAVTVAENLPESESGASSQTTSTSKSSKTEETINYEIGNTTKKVTQAPGTVERLSVGVLVDGTYTTGPNGERQYQPRSDEQLNQIRNVVQSAIGYSEQRGDRVEVVNMQFVDRFAKKDEPKPLLLGMTKEELFRIAETLVLAIVAVLVILLVVRPLIARAFETPVEEEEAEEEEPSGLLTDQSGAAASEVIPSEEEEEDELIDIARVEGQVRASTMRKVGELVEKHPEEAVSILRNWIYQESS